MSSPTDVDARRQKREEKKATYLPAFGPPPSGAIRKRVSSLGPMSLPSEVGVQCPQIKDEWLQLEAKMQEITSSSESTENKAQAKSFVDIIQSINEDRASLLKRIRKASNSWELPPTTRRKLSEEINHIDGQLLHDRTILACGKVRIYGDMVAKEPVGLICDAFFDSFLLEGRIQWPTGATISPAAFANMHSSVERQSRFQSRFRSHLKNTYGTSTFGDGEAKQESIWCPILARFIHTENATAAHIVPLSVGEVKFARMIGIDWPTQDDCYKVMWSADNGLMLHSTLEKKLDDGGIVIVPDEPKGTGAYKVVVLEAEPNVWVNGLTTDQGEYMINLRTLHNKKLTWKNDKRPSATNLYMRYLFTRIARQKTLAKGWTSDAAKMPNGTLWTDLQPIRLRMLEVLCEEFGDYAPNDDTPRIMDEVNVPSIPEVNKEEATGSRVFALQMANSLTQESIVIRRAGYTQRLEEDEEEGKEDDKDEDDE